MIIFGLKYNLIGTSSVGKIIKGNLNLYKILEYIGLVDLELFKK